MSPRTLLPLVASFLLGLGSAASAADAPVAKLRDAHPQAMLTPMTVTPFADEKTSTNIYNLIRGVASEEKLTLFDIYPRYAAELKRGPDMLNYRAYPLSKIPDNLRSIAQPTNVNGRPTESTDRTEGMGGE